MWPQKAYRPRRSLPGGPPVLSGGGGGLGTYANGKKI